MLLRQVIIIAALLWAASTASAQPVVGTYVYGDKSVDADFIMDMNNVVITKLSQKTGDTLLTREKLLQMFREIGKNDPGACLKDVACLKECAFKLNITSIITVLMFKVSDKYTLRITKYQVSSSEKEIFRKEGLADIPAMLAFIDSVRSKLVTPPNGVLILKNELYTKGAAVFINGKFSGLLPREDGLPLEAGEHKLIIRKKGYKDFKKMVSCPPGEKCSVTVTLEVKN